MRMLIYDYGFWTAVLANVLFFGLFVLAFLQPRRRVEWRSLGVFSAFLVALFAEMYGFPLTIYLLTGLLGRNYPAFFPFAHESGHLWVTLLGGGEGMLAIIHLISNSLMLGGLVLMGIGWWKIHRAKGALVTTGIYRPIRHPQYLALFAIILGSLIQWPTLPTLLMAPILLVVYSRLARREERELEGRFGEDYQRYKARTPAFLPFRRPRRVLPVEEETIPSRAAGSWPWETPGP